MNEDTFKIAEGLISSNYIRQSQQAVQTRQRLFKTLISQRTMPEVGWSDQSIEIFLQQLSQMDTNNYIGNVGVGEREGRIYSSMVSSRHFGFAHGIGRSGDVSENQPKAAGSSLLLTLTNYLALHALKISGAEQTKKCLVVPIATGMSIALVLSALGAQHKKTHPNTPKPRFVLWFRIDQKSVLKCIQTAGYTPIVIENVENYNISQNEKNSSDQDAVCSNLTLLEKKVNEIGVENILCVLSTTSCFAPRLPDLVIPISKLCKKYGVAHVVNNAYGVQCEKTMKRISSAMTCGRLDAFIQSTDKNFMVPVGGAIIASSNVDFINTVAGTYAGRASMSPILDLFVTLLSMGVKQWKALLKERIELLPYFKEKINALCVKHQESLLYTESNTISFAMTMNSFGSDPTRIGSQLFYRCVSGPRVVNKHTKKRVVDIDFQGYGSHTNNYPHHYMTMACSIGIKREEIDEFVVILDKVLTKAT
ncbi:O-phospho-L-seryl-tRNASec:L-selenocysteinyl-tRNA synthase [Acrasis kona]|uniref:O-phosphoseryl-tRNA(Sec) selenium transferase n=1 Tax=Acrasis kona TaxID=1008807 RepID=A0AAW2YKX3_9EUKA